MDLAIWAAICTGFARLFFVGGHDFSRAVNGTQRLRPAGRHGPCNLDGNLHGICPHCLWKGTASVVPYEPLYTTCHSEPL